MQAEFLDEGLNGRAVILEHILNLLAVTPVSTGQEIHIKIRDMTLKDPDRMASSATGTFSQLVCQVLLTLFCSSQLPLKALDPLILQGNLLRSAFLQEFKSFGVI